MAIERTFSIIKPNAVAKNVIGSIFARFEAAGFKIVGTKMLHLTVEQARGFYAEHDGKPFFDGLVEFMTSGPIVVSVLEGENAVQRHRDLLGATNPANALAGDGKAGGGVAVKGRGHIGKGKACVGNDRYGRVGGKRQCVLRDKRPATGMISGGCQKSPVDI